MIKSPWVFYGAGGVVVAYLLFMMIAKRRTPRGGEPEL